MPLIIHKKAVATDTYNLLERLNKTRCFEDFYLVGGTALALLLGHRESIDLDFFSQKEFNSNLIADLNEKHEVINLHKNSIEIIINDTKVMFFYFAFPRYKDLVVIDGIRMADPIDIGLMKLLALQGRCTKKDIIDLYYIDKNFIKLQELLAIFQNHYPKEKFNSYSSLKMLLDSDSLNSQPMPRMTAELDWDECYESVSSQVVKYFEQLITVRN